MKYVRLESSRDERFVFAVAPTTHAELAEAFAPKGYRPVSAGFIQIDPLAEGGVRTIGDSLSLKLAPLPEDARLIGFLYGATVSQAAK